LRQARGLATELSQEPIFRDGGALHTMFEKLPYFWTHEAMFGTLVNRESHA
jgi:hypothetical protein